jgi:hypothetical protein
LAPKKDEERARVECSERDNRELNIGWMARIRRGAQNSNCLRRNLSGKMLQARERDFKMVDDGGFFGDVDTRGF